MKRQRKFKQGAVAIGPDHSRKVMFHQLYMTKRQMSWLNAIELREYRQRSGVPTQNQAAPTIQIQVRATAPRNCRTVWPRKAVTCCMWRSALIIPRKSMFAALGWLGRRANVVAAAMKRGTMPLNNSEKLREWMFFVGRDSFRHLPKSLPRSWDALGLLRHFHHCGVGVDGAGLSFLRYLATHH